MEAERTSINSYTYYLWAFFERFGASVCSFGGNLALAFLLTPADFGLVAMLGVFTTVAIVLIDSGFSDAFLNLPHPTPRDFDTLFWFNTAVGVVIAVLYVCLSPIMANVLHTPQLRTLLIVFGINAIPSAMAIAPITWLRSKLQFRDVALINVAATITAIAVAISLAWYTHSYWALVALQIVHSLFIFIATTLRARQLPRLQFDVARFHTFRRFGSNLLITAIVTQISQNIFALVLGSRYSTSQAGYFGQAQKLQQTPVNSLEAAVSSTTFIVGGKQEHTEQRTDIARRMYARFTLMLAVVCCEVIAIANPLIHCILPDIWIPAIAYLQLLFAWALVYPVNNYMMVIFKLFDSTHIIRNIICAERAALIIAVFALWRYGVATLIGVAILLSVATLIANITLAARATSTSFFSWLFTYAVHLLAGAALAAPSALIAALLPPTWEALIAAAAIWLALLAAAYFLLRKKYPNICHFSP